MQYKCDKCNDSGSLNKFGPYYDCTSCDSAEQRVELEKFRDELLEKGWGFDDIAFAIHQRALAMAPKQEASEPVMQDCGACLGSGWVSRDADIGTEQECFSCDGSGKSADAAPPIVNGALTEEQVVCALGCIANGRNAGYISTENAKAVREFIRAAPAAANGAMPELPDPETIIVESDLGHRAYSADQMRAYGQACHALGRGAAVREYVENGTFKQPILAAAGPNAALVWALEEVMRPYGIYDVAVSNAGALQLDFIAIGQKARAALSGAKGD